MPKTVMDGTEQTLFENTEMAEFNGWLIFKGIPSGGSFTVRRYIKDVETESYELWLAESISGLTGNYVKRIDPVSSKVGFKVTVQQTAGTYITVDHMWFKR